MTDPRKLHGMILAAGYGTRLAPLTDHVPKPLLPVGGKCLLDHAIDGLTRAGIDRIGVNTHHLPEPLEAHLKGRADAARFEIFRETEILGTGGALFGAADFLAEEPDFVIYNGDVLCDADLAPLLADHRQSGALATLLLVDWPRVNTVSLAPDGAITAIGGTGSGPEPGAEARSLTYAGIGVFSRDLLTRVGPGFSSLITPLVAALTTDPGRVRGYVSQGCAWTDLGTPRRYLEAVDSAGEDTDLLRVRPITGHGSDRRFWRQTAGHGAFVTMLSPATDPEFDHFLAIGRFLHAQGLGAPEILAHNAEETTVVMEDAGSASLYGLANGPDADGIHAAYSRVVGHLVKLQQATDAAVQDCPLAVERTLDYTGLRWETSYFSENYLKRHRGLDCCDTSGLESEFHCLAMAVSLQPQVLIHRDFQSQNILLQGSTVRLVDFQGLRLGPLGYDIMSLLLDPYVPLSEAEIEDQLGRFATAVAAEPTSEGYTLTAAEVRAMALAAGLQRLMQALGAYTFLGLTKGKTDFLAHIPRAEARLVRLLDEVARLNRESEAPDLVWLPAPLTRLQAVMTDGENSLGGPS